jgi:gas vesicle protein
MFTFMLGAIGGAVVSGTYVLLRTPRTGKENQKFVKEFYQTTKSNVDNVSDKVGDVQAAVNNLKLEVNKLQLHQLPDIMNDVNDLQTEAKVYSRRINDGITVINNEVDAMKARINRKTDLPEKIQNN